MSRSDGLTSAFEPARPNALRIRLAAPALGRAGFAYLLLLPSLIVLAGFTYWPVVRVVWDSLLARHPGAAASFAGLANYRALFADGAFRHALLNNLVYALGTGIPSLVIALWLAMALARSTRLNTLLRSLVFMPVLLPLVAAAALFLFIFLPHVGLVDYYTGRLFVNPPNWLGDPDIALWSIVAITIWKNAGYYMLFFLAGLQAIPPDAYEAAVLDGANPWQRLRYVTLPYLRPTIAFVFIIALLNIVTQVDHVFVLTKGGPSDSTNLLLFYIYQQAAENYDIGRASAATIVSLALLFLVTLGSLRSLERSLGGDPS